MAVCFVPGKNEVFCFLVLAFGSSVKKMRASHTFITRNRNNNLWDWKMTCHFWDWNMSLLKLLLVVGPLNSWVCMVGELQVAQSFNIYAKTFRNSGQVSDW